VNTEFPEGEDNIDIKVGYAPDMVLEAVLKNIIAMSK
jgi:hypothetical protein